MYKLAEIVVVNYKPLYLEKDMLFYKVLKDSDKSYIEVFPLRFIPQDTERFLVDNGYPVEFCICDANGDIIVESHEIGWIDDGAHTDKLRDITLKDINGLFKDCNGQIMIDIKEDVEGMIPIYQNEKVVLTFPLGEEE